jgi:hypothetical protein
MPSSVCAVVMVAAWLALAVVSVCWTAKHPPKGPVAAVLKQRTVQTFPAEAIMLLIKNDVQD